jgi:IS30 family transposase
MTFFTDIIYRFGVPNSIITDNGSQFTGRKFLEFCDKFHIRVDWAVMAHPQTNGQVEHTNGLILQGLKSRILINTMLSNLSELQTITLSHGRFSKRSISNISENLLQKLMETLISSSHSSLY